MKTQAEHDAQRQAAYKGSSFSPHSGVACDKCQKELLYCDNIERASFPPKRMVKCSGCGITTFILA